MTNQVEITGEELARKQPLQVKIGGREILATSLEMAAKQYRDFIEAGDLGASQAPACVVREVNAKQYFAKVSYNGRVWMA